MRSRSLLMLMLAIAILGISGCAQVSGDGDNATIRHNFIIAFVAGGFGLACLAGAVGTFQSDGNVLKRIGAGVCLVLVGLAIIGLAVPNYAFSKVVITPETVTIFDSGWFSTTEKSFSRDGVSITVEERTRMTRRGPRKETDYIFHSNGQSVDGGGFGEAIADYLTEHPYSGGGDSRMRPAANGQFVAPSQATPARTGTHQAANLDSRWPPIQETQLPGYAQHQAEQNRKRMDDWRSKRGDSMTGGGSGINPNWPNGGTRTPGSGMPNSPGSGTGKWPGRTGPPGSGIPGRPGFGSQPNFPNRPQSPGIPSRPGSIPRPPGFGGRSGFGGR